MSKWDVSNVTTLYKTFHQASAFNSDLSAWDVSKVIYMTHMFNNASLFNTDISKWVLPEVVAMSYLFLGATSFNIDVSKWLTKTSKVTSLAGVFYKASSFNGGKVFVFFRQLILFGTFQFFSPARKHN